MGGADCGNKHRVRLRPVWLEDTQFIIDPVHWYMAARIGPHPDPKKNLWRISYGELPGLSNEELMERQEMKFEQMLPGHPKPGDYRVVAKSPYKVHQRCCESMRINRIMLAAMQHICATRSAAWAYWRCCGH